MKYKIIASSIAVIVLLILYVLFSGGSVENYENETTTEQTEQ